MPDGSAIATVASPQVDIYVPDDFPADIKAELRNLARVRERTEEIATNADGQWLGGYVGWDAVAGLLPGIGAVYSTYKQFQLQSCAGQARCGFGIRLMGFLIGAFDIGVGLIMGFGDIIDIFLRSSAIFGNSIVNEIERKQVIAQSFREQGDYSQAAMDQLRTELFHRGQDEQTRQLKMIGGLALLGFLLYNCAG
ncbi:MAG: DUF4112 domain-containing protein [Pseudomonadota bacterium]